MYFSSRAFSYTITNNMRGISLILLYIYMILEIVPITDTDPTPFSTSTRRTKPTGIYPFPANRNSIIKTHHDFFSVSKTTSPNS